MPSPHRDNCRHCKNGGRCSEPHAASDRSGPVQTFELFGELLPQLVGGLPFAFTQADLTKLRKAGYDAPFASVEEGVTQYVDWLSKNV